MFFLAARFLHGQPGNKSMRLVWTASEFFQKIEFRLDGKLCFIRPKSAAPDMRSGQAMAEYSLGRLRSRGGAPPIQIILFYLDEKVLFAKSRCSVCTGAPVLRTLGPSSFQLHRIDERFARTGGNICLAVLPALVPGWPRLGFEIFRGRPARADA